MNKEKLLSGIGLLLCAGIISSCSMPSSDTIPADAGVVSEKAVQDPLPPEETMTARESTTEPENITGNDSTTDAVTLKLDADPTAAEGSHAISDQLYGIFFEDINYAADGGLYAEMIKNRSFEYGTSASGGRQHGWSVTDPDAVTFEVADGALDESFLHPANPSYAVITNCADTPNGIANKGFLDGIAVEEGKTYRFSAFLRNPEGYQGNVTVRLEDADGTIYAQAQAPAPGAAWEKLELELVPNQTVNNHLRLSVNIEKGTLSLDMVSLFPANTYRQRENGLRCDLAEYLEALSPAFLRFPGGCAVEGRDTESIYNWKDSIGNGEALTYDVVRLKNGSYEKTTVTTTGDAAVRPQAKNIWKGTGEHPYYMTYGLGFYEYFLLCEDLGCLPVPTLNAGMTCPIQSENYQVFHTDSDEFAQCVQDALDLVEFCRGGSDTKWGAVRIAMGHEEPFSLRYIGIGNEQWQTEYYQHYEKFKEAFDQAAQENPALYGDIELIVANGPSSGDTFGWERIQKQTPGSGKQPADYAGLVDEHYYESPSWLKSNANRYDSYDRSCVPVFLGEYAAKSNTMKAALAEAAFMTGLEKNGDIVKMSCYAPLYGNETTVQWEPDLIWFSNDTVYGSANYYVQKLFMTNPGATFLAAGLSGVSDAGGLTGRVGLGTWATSARFDDLKVVSNATGEVLWEESFDGDSLDFEPVAGSFRLADGCLLQQNTASPKNSNTGDVGYFGASVWQDYTLTVKATKTGGAEGFLIPVAVQDKDNCIFWNVGGWNNTVSCLQIVSDGVKSGQIAGTTSELHLATGVEYTLKVEMTHSQIRCFIDGKQVLEYTQEAAKNVYQACSIAENGDLILKLVNTTQDTIPVSVSIDHFEGFSAAGSLQVVAGASGESRNTLQDPDAVTLKERSIEVGSAFDYEMPGYSASVIRIPAK